MTVLELGQVLLLVLTCCVAIVTLARYFGGRARTELETANIALASREATLVEKDRELEGMSERLARLDEMLSQAGGSKVYEVLLVMQAIQSDQQLAQQRFETRIVGLIEKVGQDIAAYVNGKQRD